MLLRDYGRIVRRRWKLILACFIGTIAIAALATTQMTPQYASSARLFVSNPETNSADAYQGSLLSEQRVSSYANLATGQELARRVISDLHLHMKPAELTQRLQVGVIPSTVVLQVTVTEPNPREAQTLTQAVAQEFTRFVAELETPPGKSKAPIKATIVDPASLPATPVSPRPLRNVGVAGFLGLLLGLGAAVLRELLDTTVKSQDDVVQTTGAAVIGTIAFDPVGAKKLFMELGTRAPRVEAFRVLRTNLQFVDVDHPSKVFVVTSSVPEEGKTTTAANLALALAQAGQQVLLLEADLRRPKLPDKLHLESAVGLTTVLVGRSTLEDAVQEFPAGRLSVLTSGALPPNPAELLQSKAMSDIIERARTSYDVILLDAPPLLPVTDAALLTAQSDGALIVVRHGSTTREQLRHAMDRLAAVDGRALGVVLNMVPKNRAAGYGEGYGYGYEPETGQKDSAGARDAISVRAALARESRQSG